MTLNLTIPQTTYTDFTPRITVIGVGGGGTNAVDNMITANLQGVEFAVANTDAQQLVHSRADRKIQLGPHITQGLGAGAKPEIGKAAAEEAADELYRHLDGCHMVFITAGMGGGTGTGAAPVIARMARERNILTVGVVTKPFGFEGARRMRAAEQGIEELQQYVDTLIVIPNQNLFRMANERTTWKDAFKMADQVLYMGVRGVTDLMLVHGLVNLDFADIRTVMAEMGKAMMGTGEAEGENRAIRAAEAAINNPLLEDTSMAGARGLLINITGGEDLTLFEVDQAANRIREEVDDEANVIFGSAVDETLNGRIRVSVVATGIDTPRAEAKPRLSVVGNGGVRPEPRPIVVPAGNAAPAEAAATPGLPPLRHASSQPMPEPMVAEPVPMFDGQLAVQAVQPEPMPIRQPPQLNPLRQPAPMREEPDPNLFTEPAAPVAVAPMAPPAEAARGSSIFTMVTGLAGTLRRRQPAPAAPASVPPPAHPAAAPVARREPVVAEVAPAPQPRVRPAQTEDDVGLDIPAFLRRQSN